MNSDLLKKYKYIIRDKGILGGKPIILGTRIAVAQVLRCLSHGSTLEDMREMYGEFPEGAIPEVLRFASAIVEQEKFDVAS